MVNFLSNSPRLETGKQLAVPRKSEQRIRQLKKFLVSIACAGVWGALASAACAQDATWNGHDRAQWGLGISWDGGQVPTRTARFGTLLLPGAVGFADGYDGKIENIEFMTDASAYVFNIGGLLTGTSLAVTGQGIINNATLPQTFNVGGLLGSGTLSFTGKGTTAGNILINVGASGNLCFSGSSTADTSNIAVDSGGVLDFSGNATGGNATVDLDRGGRLGLASLASGKMTLASLTGSGDVNLGANVLSLGGRDASMVFDGTITGTGGLEKTGSGLLTLSGNNSFSGDFQISGGRVLALTDTALGSGDINLSGGGTVILGIAGNWNNRFNVAAGAAGSIGALSSQNVNLPGGLNIGVGSALGIGQSGNTGTITFNGSTSSLGIGASVSVGYGGVRLGDAAAGNFFNVEGTVLNLSEGTNLNLNGYSMFINELRGAGNISSSVTGNPSLNLRAGIFSGNISDGAGTLSLVKSGDGTLSLSGNNDFSGGFSLQGGSLLVSSNDALGTGALTLANGTGFLISNASITNNLVFNGLASLGVNGSDSGTVKGNISGSYGLIKTGTGTLNLSGNSTFGGGINLNAGTLVVRSLGALGTGDVTLGNGTELRFAVSGNYNNGIRLGAGKNATISVDYFARAALVRGLSLEADAALSLGSVGNDGTLIAYDGTFSPGSGLALDQGKLYVGNAAFGKALDTVAVAVNINGAFYLNSLDATLGSLTGKGQVVLNGNTLKVGTLGSDTDFSGVISATGRFVKTGTGALTLSGRNTFHGGFSLDSGTLVAGNNSALGTGTVQLGAGTTLGLKDGITLANTIVLNGTASFDVSGSASGASGGVISGGFGLSKTGTGTLVLSGDNTFSGGINLNAGTLVANSRGALGLDDVTFGNGAELLLTVSSNYNNGIGLGADVNAALSARTGADIHLLHGLSLGSNASLALGSAGHTGTLVIYGDSTFETGAGLSLDYGRLGIGDAAFGNALSATAVSINGNNILDLNGFNASLGSLSGSGGISLGGNVLSVGMLGANTGFGGIISGTGSLIKTGTGELTLTGNNTFGGQTHIMDGALNADGSLLSSVAVDAGAILAGNGSVGDVMLTGALVPGRNGIAGTLQTGSLHMASGASVNFDLNDPDIAGKTGNDLIVVNGDLTLDGTLNIASAEELLPGVYRLINYSGTLIDNGLDIGRLPSGVKPEDAQIQTIINNRINFVNAGGSTVQFWNGSKTIADGTIRGGHGIWRADTTNWTGFNGLETHTWRGDLAVFQGAGGVATVEGDITFSGVQFADNGFRIQAASDAVFSARNDAVLRVDSGISGEINAGITAAGSIRKVGEGRLVLSGANTLPGGLKINRGTVVAAHSRALGAGNVTFNNISGLTFAIDGNWTNRITVNSGAEATLAARTGGQVTLTRLNTADNATIRFGTENEAGTITVTGAGNAMGARSNIQVNAGRLVAGDAAFGTALSRGALRVASSGKFDLNGFDFAADSLAGSGTIANDGKNNAVIRVRSGNFSGRLSDGGGMLGLGKIGDGTLVLSGYNTYSGTTLIGAGTLKLDGILENSHVRVLSGARLVGSGTMAALVAESGSFIVPGSGAESVGTLRVKDSLTINGGANYMVNVVTNAGSSQLLINRNAILKGGNVLVNGLLQSGARYSILSAKGGISGTFKNLKTSLASDFLTSELVYSKTDVTLKVTRNNVLLPEPGGTESGDGTSGKSGVRDAVSNLSGDNPISLALFNTTYANAVKGLQQLSGEIYATSKTVLMDNARFGQRLVTARLNSSLGIADAGMASAPLDTTVTASVSPDSSTERDSLYPDKTAPAVYDGGTVWMQGYGSWGAVDTTSRKSGFKRDTGGAYFGLDAPVSDWLVGVAGGFSHTNFNTKRISSSGDIGSWHLALYGGTHYKKFNVRLGTQQAWHSIDTSRSINFAGYSDYLIAGYHSRSTQIFGDIGVPLSYGEAVVEPFAGISYNYLHSGGFSERGGPAALYAGSSHDNLVTGTLGLRTQAEISYKGDKVVMLRGMAGWRHNYDDISPETWMSFVGSGDFSVSGLPFYRDALALAAGVDFTVTNKITFGVIYDGQISSGSNDHGVRINLRAKY